MDECRSINAPADCAENRGGILIVQAYTDFGIWLVYRRNFDLIEVGAHGVFRRCDKIFAQLLANDDVIPSRPQNT